MPVTDFIKTTENLLAVFTSKLTTTQPTWTVRTYSGSGYADLFRMIPELDALTNPVAIVIYSGSDYKNDPRRTARVSVMVVRENSGDVEAEKITARAMMDSVLSVLDEQIEGTVFIRAVSDNSADLGEGIAAYIVEFEAQDR